MTTARIARVVPPRFQVPVRYWKRRLTHGLEVELPWFLNQIPSGRRVLDIGANFGNYSYAALRRGHPVDAFEPLPACHDILTAFRHPRLRVHPIALSDTEGTANLTVPWHEGRYEPGLATLARSRWATSRPTRQVTVPVGTLDAFGFTDVGGIKIDVEGFEPAVLRGAVETIRENHRPVLLTELVHQWLDLPATFAQIEGMGYRGSYLAHDLTERDVAMYTPDLDTGTGRRINTFLWRPR